MHRGYTYTPLLTWHVIIEQGYDGWDWCITNKEDPSKTRCGFANTRWGARWAAKHEAKHFTRIQNKFVAEAKKRSFDYYTKEPR